LSHQSSAQPAGEIMVSGQAMPLRPTGNLSNIEELENLVIHGRDTGKLIRLKDIADVSRGIAEKPQNIVLFNGKPALNIGISFASGVNVVDIGKHIKDRLIELDNDIPSGMNIEFFYDQSAEVEKSIDGFIMSLVQAVAIVIIVLLIAMGLRSGLIIGLVLLLTVFGTFILMDYNNIELHRISLGALIIALGMLVDNAIVVLEGILVGIRKGLSKTQAAAAIVKQTQWPLLAATVIAITAFAPIGLSSDSTGEFMGSLFWVLCYSLFLSWITAITITPFLAEKFLKANDKNVEEGELYKGVIFTLFRTILKFVLKFRWFTILGLVALLSSAIFSFGFVKQQFFPVSNTPIFYLNVWMPEGTDIRETTRVTKKIESYVRSQNDVEYVTTTIGQGLQRYSLTYQPEKSYESYAQLLIRTSDLDKMFNLITQLDNDIAMRFPQADFRMQVVEFGPSPASKIEARVVGADPQVLKDIGADIEAIIAKDPGARNITNNWREQIKTMVPQFNESKARRFGISKEDLSNTLNMAFGGSNMGILRDGTKQLPIVARLP
ncbi:MAG: efflux RND transporter permease subunit, partial [Psychromonas sp.]